MAPDGPYRIGDTTVTRIREIPLDDVEPGVLFPDLDDAVPRSYRAVATPGSFDAASGLLRESIHSWLLRGPFGTVLVDTATGNNKDLPDVPRLHRLREPFLDRLAAAGVAPDDVDAVLLTHVHADHVGWNTRLERKRWVPTFPRAVHMMSAVEERYGKARDGAGAAPDLPPPELGPRRRLPTAGVWRQSVAPVVEAGLHRFVPLDGSDVLPGLSFHATPGHSVDHASIRLRSGGEQTWFLGDVLHHPLQVVEPDLCSTYCEFPEAARRSRAAMLERAASSGSLCFSIHFAESSAGRVVRTASGGYRWEFAS